MAGNNKGHAQLFIELLDKLAEFLDEMCIRDSLGSNFPFAEVYEAFKNTEKFIQVDIDPYKLGKRHALDASILGDAGQACLLYTSRCV